ncbi:tail assembly chaperone [Gordonia phage Lucky10]|jgi:hypothetical protein|uniref:Tail assembly chaperone n=1 Tax=Gordonia phage Lucky10 TaxID=1821557 RepID=A0A142KAX3_9CAUD|nr:tail assembly chaperone [Gordonia phage Lucky10]AMS03256.1 tail assembly chaperone [Gordonia phage Lucky10]
MSVPEGYAVAPSSDDQLIKFAVPIPGRDEPILVSMPPRKWMAPDEVKKYEDWIKPFGEAEARIIEWVNATNHFDPDEEGAEKPVRPTDDEKLMTEFNEHEVTLRWLKPHVTAAEYKLLMTKLPDGTVEWIKKQIADPDIAVGESSASVVS